MRKPLKSTAISESSLIGPLILISKSMRNLMNLKLVELGIVAGQDDVLLALQNGPKTVGAIAHLILVRPSTVSKTVVRLGDMGFTTRMQSAEDLRNTIISLTPRGEEMASRIRALNAEINHDLLVYGRAQGLKIESIELDRILVLLTSHLRRYR